MNNAPVNHTVEAVGSIDSIDSIDSVDATAELPNAQSLAAAMNDVLDDHADFSAARGRLFSFRIANKLPTWVIETDLEQFQRELAEALRHELDQIESAEMQVECRLIDGTVLHFVSRDPQAPKDETRTKTLLKFEITPASNRETFQRLLSQARGSTNLGTIKTLLRGLKFLIVDDSPDTLDVECALLTDLGGEADPAHNGEEAIQKAQSGDYDLILMDIQMPVMGGDDAMKAMIELGLKTPVIAVSAVSSRVEREESFKCGFKDYLTKPFNADQLIRTILRLTKRPIPIASRAGTVHSVHA